VPVDVANVARDYVDWIVIIFGTASGVAGIVGLFIAIAAYRSTKQQATEARRLIAKERRTTFELEVLRDMLGVIDAHANSVDMPHYTRLALIPPDELQFWRFLADLPALRDPTAYATAEAKNATVTAQIVQRMDVDGVPAIDDTSLSAAGRFGWRVRLGLLRDVQNAIDRRVNAEHGRDDGA
jgi:hypothetical protein